MMTETSAEVFSDNSLPKDTIRVSAENPWKLKKGDKALVYYQDEFRQVASVDLVLGTVAEKDRNHIHSSRWTGTQGQAVTCKLISQPSYMWNIFLGSPKLKTGLFLTIIAIGSAYLNAALTRDGNVQLQLGRWRWILFACTVASVLGSFIKDFW